jgi:hypothetical protein
MRSPFFKTLGAALAIELLIASAPLRAQPSPTDKAAAQALFDQGKKALDAGDYQVACTRLEQSQHIDPAIGTLLYLAECYEKTGRTASAWALFRQGASEAQAAGEAERARLGTEEADKLEPKLSMLSIAVAPEDKSLSDFKIERGKESVSRSLWGVAVPVDPGQIAIMATAPGHAPWKKTVTVAPDAARVSVTVPPLVAVAALPAPSPKPAPAPVPAPAPPPPLAAPPPPKPAPPNGDTQRLIGVIVGGVGVVGLGLGTYFGLHAISKNKDAKPFCTRGTVCYSEQGVSLTNDAKTSADISDIAFVAGAAALAGGVVLYLTAPSNHAEQVSRLRLAPAVGPNSAGAMLGGQF